MIETNFETIKKRTLERSLKLWRIDNMEQSDPVIELLLDVFSYELAKLHHDLSVSDAKLIERLSKILVNEKWSLPQPAHALLSVTPKEKPVTISEQFSFYKPKGKFGSDNSELYFSPIYEEVVVPANVSCMVFDNQLCIKDEHGAIRSRLVATKETKFEDYHVYIGIAVEDDILKNTSELSLSLLLNDSEYDSFLSMCEVYDLDDNPLQIHPIPQITDTVHYTTHVFNYYKNYLYKVTISNASKKKQHVNTFIKRLFYEEDIEDFNSNLFWLKLKLPTVFTSEELQKLNVSTNTFPVVNRRLRKRQHNIKKNGKIVSLPSTDDDYFLGISSVEDSKGRTFINVLKNDINKPEGSYALYFGNIEQFDERSAKSLLLKALETVREEGSAFSAVGYDLLNAYLVDLNDRLDDLEQKVNNKYRNVSDNNQRQYLIITPYNDTEFVDCEYWITNPKIANNFKPYSKLMPVQESVLEDASISLQTSTTGGDIKNTEKEKISNLRYGLLSRERIVSREDIKEFVASIIGRSVDKINVKPGVGIHPDPKKGLQRTTDVVISIKTEVALSDANKKKMAHYIKTELQDKSIYLIPYKVDVI